MNRIPPNLPHSENDRIISTNNNLRQSEIHSNATESKVSQLMTPVQLTSEEIESHGNGEIIETSIQIEDISHERADIQKIGNEEVFPFESIKKKFDGFERRFERLERAIFHLTEYLTK